MGRTRINKREVRKIQQSKGSYYVTMPVELVREFKWKEGQKVVVKKYGKNKLIIEDWK